MRATFQSYNFHLLCSIQKPEDYNRPKVKSFSDGGLLIA